MRKFLILRWRSSSLSSRLDNIDCPFMSHVCALVSRKRFQFQKPFLCLLFRFWSWPAPRETPDELVSSSQWKKKASSSPGSNFHPLHSSTNGLTSINKDRASRRYGNCASRELLLKVAMQAQREKFPIVAREKKTVSKPLDWEKLRKFKLELQFVHLVWLSWRINCKVIESSNKRFIARMIHCCRPPKTLSRSE